MFKDNMDAELYSEILCNNLIPDIATVFNRISDVIIHQDNDPKHSSRICKRVLKDNGIFWVSKHNSGNSFYNNSVIYIIFIV